MLLSELEIRHSRAIAPTRRIALGDLWLPTDPAPGFGGILLAGIVASAVGLLDDELRDELDILIDDLEGGRRIAQPRLRHRFQVDVVGLDRSRHALMGNGEDLHVEDLWGHAVSLDFTLFQPQEMAGYLRSAEFAIDTLLERDPYPDVEYQSRRCYILARRPR